MPFCPRAVRIRSPAQPSKMLYTQDTVRDNIRNRDGNRVFYLGRDDILTSGARDYLNRERIEILPADQARPQRYRLLNGGYLEEKPEHMTHLNAQILVRKNHPRILFRGKLDTLEAEMMLCQLKLPECAARLQQLLELAREIMGCDVLEKPLKEGTLCGLSEAELRHRSHFPQAFYGQPHFMPSFSDGETIACLNRLRCVIRETEVAAVDAFMDTNGQVERTDILRSLNRMSSMLYLLMIRQKQER